MICSYCCAKWGWKFRNLLASAGPLILTALRKGVGPRCYVTVGNLVPIQWPADAFFFALLRWLRADFNAWGDCSV